MVHASNVRTLEVPKEEKVANAKELISVARKKVICCNEKERIGVLHNMHVCVYTCACVCVCVMLKKSIWTSSAHSRQDLETYQEY